MLRFTVLLLWASATFVSLSAPWSQFLGPERNGNYAGPLQTREWPKEGPPKLWSASIGAGFAGPVGISNQVLMFHRKGNKETLTSYEAQTGRALWEGDYPTAYSDDFGFDEGPRATPAIADDHVFTYGADGMISAWKLKDGKLAWQVDAKEKFGSQKGFFGRAPSPLVVDGNVIVHVGGKNGAGVVALKTQDGSLAWKSNDEEASYASPAVAEFGGKKHILLLTREQFLLLDAPGGKVTHEFPFKPSMNASVSAATPLVAGNLIFLTASYGAGAVGLRFRDNALETLWRGDDKLSSHYATPVIKDGLVFGFDGRQEQGPEFVCLELATGREKWRATRFGAGTVTLADKDLLILTEKGELMSVPASGSAFVIGAKAQILGFDTRAHPAISEGLFVARDKQKVVCIDLRLK